jgi:preprotein translocase subunit SecG
MAIFSTLIQVVQIISALVVIGLVLMQHGKGADMGAAFGSGASGSVFGASGSANFLSRLTAGAAATFFITTLMLAFVINGKERDSNSVMKNLPGITAPATTPATPATPAVPKDSAVPAPATPVAPASIAPAAPAPAQVPKQ